jgi:hypothetical protein
MKKSKLLLVLLLAIVSSAVMHGQGVPVKADHVIFVLEENYAQPEIIGSTYAPTITAVSKLTTTVNFTQDYAITHPSEPNYLELFSGSDQGVTADESGPDANAPFNDCNLASSLIQSGYTFIGYSEDQPSVGWIANDDGNYYTKHSPWINWIGYNTHADTIPKTSDVPFSYANGYTSGPIFPDSNNYSTLPTVAWVIPNIVDDMHNPATPSTAISNGDTWYKTNMMPLIRWASIPANKTIVITIWDEDDDDASGTNYHNNIPLLITSGMVVGQNNATTLNHYDVLKTVEDMYSLTDCGSSATGVDFPVIIWNTTSATSIVNSNTSECAKTGEATVTASGGTTPYTYSWTTTPIQKTATATGLSAGSYTATITANNGGAVTEVITITEPASLTTTLNSSTNITCHGDVNGIATSAVSGGLSPYTYSWTGGGNNATATGLSVGTYTLNVTDKNGCTSSISVTITQPTALSTALNSSTNITCHGDNNGVISSTVSGGTSPYTYSWTGGATTPDISGLSAGTYNLNVTDKNGCTGSISVTITQPTSLSAALSNSTNITCHGDNNGSAVSTVSGGTSPYTYTWTGGAGNNATASNLAPGTYTLSVKDNNGCTNSVVVTITQPPTLSANLSSMANVTCHGDNNGTASAAVSGGTLPYTYTWSGGAGNNATANNLAPGTYTLNVTDNNGCISSTSVTITQPANSLSTTASTTTNVSCSTTGSVSSSVSGGTSPYTYVWSAFGGNSTTATGLPAGTYTISVTDNNGCTNSATTVITQPANSVTVATNATTNVTCYGGNTGSASSNVSGGNPPYTYSWSGGAGTNTTANGLISGTYTLSVTDNSGCSGVGIISITQPAILTASVASSTNITCYGSNSGSASPTINGGTAPYTYSWTGGAGNNATATGLTAGAYTLTVTDACGGDIATTSVIITQPSSLNLSAIATATISCYGDEDGSASSTLSGGTTPYTYSWTDGAGNNTTATGLSAGTYTLTATDACGGDLATVSVIITGPLEAITVTEYSQDDNGTSNGIAAVSVSGGTIPYTYNWTTGGETTDTIKNQSAGDYCCAITDANGCTNTACVTILSSTGIATISSISSINIYPDPNNGCFTVAGLLQGEVIELYNYMGQKLSSMIVTNSTTMHFDISNKANGVYLIRVENADGNIIVEKKMLKAQ